MNIDLIVAYPDNCDYPLWRDWIKKNRKHFDKVIVVFTKTNGRDNYKEFVRSAMIMERVIFIDNPELTAGQDWRDVAMNEAIKYSSAKWIYFTEQDFIPVGFYMGRIAILMSEKYECIGAYDGGRLHPCAIFITRELLDKTNKYFGIKADKYDHFGQLQIDVEAMAQVGRIPEKSYLHFNGYSHNWRLISEGEVPNYKPDQFIQSLKDSLDVGVSLDPKWVEIAVKAIERYEMTFLDKEARKSHLNEP